MKILLNGATGGTNFGDFLFAEIFQNCTENIVGKENVYWYESRYQMSDFFKKHLGYQYKKYNLNDIDALVCISGGYFCGNDKTYRDYFIRYWRYFRICLKCIRKKIPIAIIGLEVAQSKNILIDRIQKYILNHAHVITVRNKQSLEQLEKYGVHFGVCTADTAHTILTTLNFQKNQNANKMLGRRSLFFHVQLSDIDMAQRVISVLNQFLDSHREYDVYVGTDQLHNRFDELDMLAGQINASQVTVLPYDYPVEFCSVLSQMDFLITPKLHVGIVGATLSKSVVSFSVHSYKIQRFYHQLSADERSLSMNDFSEEKALEMMEKFHDMPLIVPDDVLKASYDNLDCLESFIKSLYCDSVDR